MAALANSPTVAQNINLVTPCVNLYRLHALQVCAKPCVTYQGDGRVLKPTKTRQWWQDMGKNEERSMEKVNKMVSKSKQCIKSTIFSCNTTITNYRRSRLIKFRPGPCDGIKSLPTKERASTIH